MKEEIETAKEKERIITEIITTSLEITTKEIDLNPQMKDNSFKIIGRIIKKCTDKETTLKNPTDLFF